jgi:hypothetical protein
MPFRRNGGAGTPSLEGAFRSARFPRGVEGGTFSAAKPAHPYERERGSPRPRSSVALLNTPLAVPEGEAGDAARRPSEIVKARPKRPAALLGRTALAAFDSSTRQPAGDRRQRTGRPGSRKPRPRTPQPHRSPPGRSAPRAFGPRGWGAGGRERSQATTIGRGKVRGGTACGTVGQFLTGFCSLRTSAKPHARPQI